MPERHDYLLHPSIVAGDRLVLQALRSFGDYTPRNEAYGVAPLGDLEANLRQAEFEFKAAGLAYEAARTRLITCHWAFHNGIIGAKPEVISQYGADSTHVLAIGLKRKSEHKRSSRRTAPKS